MTASIIQFQTKEQRKEKRKAEILFKLNESAIKGMADLGYPVPNNYGRFLELLEMVKKDGMTFVRFTKQEHVLFNECAKYQIALNTYIDEILQAMAKK